MTYVYTTDGILADSQNISAYTPVQHPQGNGGGAIGHRLAWLDQNNYFLADQMVLQSSDPTIGAGAVLFTGTPPASGTLVIRLTYNNAPGSPYDFSYSWSGAPTLPALAQALSEAILADTVLQAARIGSQWPTHFGSSSAAITQSYRTHPLTLAVQSQPGAPLGVALAQPAGDVLDAAPVWQLSRLPQALDGVPRTPKPGDNLGQVFAGGPNVETPNAVTCAYTGWQHTIIDPRTAVATGQQDWFARYNGTWYPVLGLRNGIGLWGYDGAPPVFNGVGTLTVPATGSYYLGTMRVHQGDHVNELTVSSTAVGDHNTTLAVDNSTVPGGYNAILRLTNSVRSWLFKASGAADGVDNSGGFAIHDATANAYRFFINSLGCIGIGGNFMPTAQLSFGSSTIRALMNLPVGNAPTNPNDGDVWRETNTDTGLKIRINGATRTIMVS